MTPAVRLPPGAVLGEDGGVYAADGERYLYRLELAAALGVGVRVLDQLAYRHHPDRLREGLPVWPGHDEKVVAWVGRRWLLPLSVVRQWRVGQLARASASRRGQLEKARQVVEENRRLRREWRQEPRTEEES